MSKNFYTKNKPPNKLLAEVLCGSTAKEGISQHFGGLKNEDDKISGI
jgi:hypothetical protein